MPAPIALQLYTVRKNAEKQGYANVVRKVAAMGYAGVEPAGFPGSSAADADKLFKELGYSDQQINHYTARAAEGETAVGDFEDILSRLKRAEKEAATLPKGW